MENKEAYQARLEAQLKEWNAKIAKLRAKAEHASAQAKIEYYKQLELLRPKQEAAQRRLKELQTAGQEAWQDIKVGVDRAWAELKNALDKARTKFE